MFGRPGFRTSEFISALVNVIVQIALAWNGTVSDSTATHLSVYGAIAFILSRGLAKYEPRATVPVVPAATVTTAAAPPAA